MTFFEMRVPLWMWIVSQVFGVISLVIWVIVYQQKNKARQLGLSAVGNIVGTIGNAFLFNFLVVGLAGVSGIKNATFAYTNKKGVMSKETLISLVVLFCWVNFIVFLYTYLFWFDWLILACIFAFNVAKAFGSIHWLKGLGFIYNALLFVNALIFMNIMGLVISTFIMGSCVVYYVKIWIAKRKTKNQINS